MKSPFPALHIVSAVLIATSSLVILQTLEKGDHSQSSNKTRGSTNDLPLSQKQYDFYEHLESNEIVITDSNYTSTPKESYLQHPTLLQIAAVRSKESATDIVNKLKTAGMETVRIVERNTNNGVLYLIRTRPYLTYASIKSGTSIAEKNNFHPDQIQIK